MEANLHTIALLCTKITNYCEKYPQLCEDISHSLENITYTIEARLQQQQQQQLNNNKRNTFARAPSPVPSLNSIPPRTRSNSVNNNNNNSVNHQPNHKPLGSNVATTNNNEIFTRGGRRRRPSEQLEDLSKNNSNFTLAPRVELMTPESLQRELDDFVVTNSDIRQEDMSNNSSNNTPLYSPKNNNFSQNRGNVSSSSSAAGISNNNTDYTGGNSPHLRRRSLRALVGDYTAEEQDEANNKKVQLRRALDEQIAEKKELKLRDMYPGGGTPLISRSPSSSNVSIPATPTGFKYSQQSVEEQEALARKFQAQQEFKKSLQMQMDEKKKSTITPNQFGQTW